jgi:hypothetical protein
VQVRQSWRRKPYHKSLRCRSYRTVPSTKRPTKTFNEEADEDDYSDTGFSRLYKQSHTSVPPSYLIVVVVLWHCYCQLCSCQLCGGERERVRACVCVRACLNLHNPDLEHLLIFEKSTHVPYFLKINTRQGIKGSPRSQLFHRSRSFFIGPTVMNILNIL